MLVSQGSAASKLSSQQASPSPLLLFLLQPFHSHSLGETNVFCLHVSFRLKYYIVLKIMPSIGKGDVEAEDLKIPVSNFIWDEQMAGRIASLHTTVL